MEFDPLKGRAMPFLKKYWHYPALLAIAGVFFINASWFNHATQEYSDRGDFVKWASPDETANYQMAKLYGQTGSLSVFERYNLYAGDIIRPRSLRSDHGELKPVSFLGLPLLYGAIVAWLGYEVLPFLTPAIAALGLVFYYILVRRLFGKTNALLSTVLLSFFPVYVYYSARSMFHNIPFTAFFVASLALLAVSARRLDRRAAFRSLKPGDSFRWPALGFFASGLALGAALAFRTSEAVWLAPLWGLLILSLIAFKRLKAAEIAYLAAGAVLAVLPMLYHNQVLYGHPLFTGYGEMNQTLAALKDSAAGLPSAWPTEGWSRARELLVQAKDYLFYFGLKPAQSAQAARDYIALMFPWLFWPAVTGGLAMLANVRRHRLRTALYLFSLALVSGLLILYYGSWTFYDNPDKAARTIGNSYTRYWLPVYLGLIPLAVYLLVRVSNLFCLMLHSQEDEEGQLKMVFQPPRVSRAVCRHCLRALAVFALSWSWFNFTYFGSVESLVPLAQRQWRSRAEWQAVQALTESNSVVVTQYHDKLFFPERKVVVGLFDDSNMIKQYANLAARLPVYYYNFTFPEADFAYLNGRRLKDAGLGLSVVAPVTEDFTLYKLELIRNGTSTDYIATSSNTTVTTRP